MDFHSLSRRELQALCKRNAIPANMTNLAMADALSALLQVEGLEEYLNPSQSDTEQLDEKDPCETPGICRTATRMSTRRKPVKNQLEPESSVISTRSCRSTRKVAVEKVASVRCKVEIANQGGENDKQGDKDAEEDAAARTRQIKPPVQQVYSTRRSVRLLERNMADLSLADMKTIEPIKMDELDMEMATKVVTRCTDKIEGADGDDLKTVSIPGLEKDDSSSPMDLEQTSLPQMEMQAEDGPLEVLGTDNYSELSAAVGVGPTFSESCPKDSDDEDEDLVAVKNENETDMDSQGKYVAPTEGGSDPLIEVLEQDVPSEVQNQILVPEVAVELEVCEKSSPEVKNYIGNQFNASAENVNEDSISNSYNAKSLRQLTKMLKEKLQLANKGNGDIPEQQIGEVRPALQVLSDNCTPVSKNGN